MGQDWETLNRFVFIPHVSVRISLGEPPSKLGFPSLRQVQSIKVK